jgi:hypothetical protein
MSLEYTKTKRDELLRRYPNDLQLIRSAQDVKKVELRNAETKGPFDNDDPKLVEAMETALVSGRQVAVQAVGPKQISLLVSKPGMKLFGVQKSSKDIAVSSIMDDLEALRKQYMDSSGDSLLTGGLDSYIYTEKLAAMAEKYSFRKHKSFALDDFDVITEVKRYLDMGHMVIVAAWGKEERIDIYLQPKVTGPSKTDGGCFIATAAFDSPSAPEIAIFYRFRDEILVRSRLGTMFVHLYYFSSPSLAKIVKRSYYLRTLVRQTLRPISRMIGVLMSRNEPKSIFLDGRR